MNLDDKICYCYHVPLRKLIHFARREPLQRASQMSGCLNAGTGCGWCIPVLKRIFKAAAAERDEAVDRVAESLPDTAEAYAQARQAYIKSNEKHEF